MAKKELSKDEPKKGTFAAMNSFAYRDKYQLFYYDVSFLRSISLTEREQHNLAEAVILEAKFKTQIKAAKNAEEIEKILEDQFRITDQGDTPKEIWLDLVEQIIEHHRLLKRGRYNLIIPVKLWFKAKRASLTSNLINKSEGKPKRKKEPINTFEEAAKNDETFKTMIKILLEKKVIDNQHNLIKPANSLYSLIRRFHEDGYFKIKFLKDLHPLVNTAFKTDGSYQHFNQTPSYDKILP